TQYHLIAQRTPEGFFIMWGDKRCDYVQNYWGQHISADGIRLWEPLGVNLADSGREQEQAAVVATSTGINFVWSESIDGIHDIAAQGFSFPGSPLWGSAGLFVVQKDSTQAYPTITSFNSGSSVVAWEDIYGDERDLYYKYISSSGQLSGDIYGNPLSVAIKSQYRPLATTLNEEAYFVWADGRSSGKTEILGLFAQKVSNSVANSDNNSPAINTIELRPNHPNPFNPSTTISFALKNNSPALELKIYNLKGQLVKTLLSGYMAQGTHSVVWDGKDNANSSVSSGVYYYQINDGKSTQQRKMVLMK
ncbi:MAG: FlgD immunoglobulin-like domain containing protein, partial [Candidatus Cloacimonetes bacterium]|nr:FlgD immunoglobulin-like domain containing protein [Candidatus Cloacimonadota bacterium]